MAPLPVEVLLGIYLGLLVGVIPALVSWGLGFVFKYVTDITVPGFGVTVLAVALAGANGGLLALADRSIIASPNAPRIVTAVLVVTMLAMYAHSRGDAMGGALPKRFSLSKLREKALSVDLADIVDGDEVRVHVVGEVADMEGYPPLPDRLRAEIRNAELQFPADLALGELERRVADRLETEFDLGDVSVTVDERGRATVVAAPPFSGLSKRVADDRHAVSVAGLIPTGLARGDEVTVITPDAQVRGTVLSARTAGPADAESGPEATGGQTPETPLHDDGGTEPQSPRPVRAPTTGGGEGRLTVAVTRTDVGPLLRADRVKIVVEPRGTRREYEAVSLLRRGNRRFRQLTVHQASELVGQRIGAVRIRERYGAAVFAIRKPGGWMVAPSGRTFLEAGDELFAAGFREALDAFEAALRGEGDDGPAPEGAGTGSDASREAGD
ncbi:MAG: potassium channel family protein [Salinirussus sp.]